MTHVRSLPPVATERARLRDVALPGWRRWAPQSAIAWAGGYGALRVYWALRGAPSPPPIDSDLILFRGWWTVALCVAAFVVVLALRVARWVPSLAVAAWSIAAALVAASALLLLDLVGILLPGITMGVDVVACLSRVACLAGGVLVGTTVLSYQRHWHGACPACGLKGETVRPLSARRWARVAVWAAVVGCLVRLLAQLGVGFGDELLEGSATIVLFEAGFLLTGTVLPMALAYPWGRVFPRWVPLMAGRGVPRWLVLGPGLVLGLGMTAYFAVTLVGMSFETVTGTFDPNDYPVWFYWVSVPAYLTWGVGLAVAALAYQRATRAPCRYCLDGRLLRPGGAPTATPSRAVMTATTRRT